MLSVRLAKPALRMLSPGGSNGKLSILIYHRVLPHPDPMLQGDPDAATFRWQMRTVSALFNVLPLTEAIERLRNGTLPPRAAAISFDDGYADNAEVALPILEELGLSATFFIATGYLDGGIMFNDKVIEILRRLTGEEVDLDVVGLGPRRFSSPADRAAIAMEVIRSIKHLDSRERQAKVDALNTLCPQPLPDDVMMTTAQVRQLADAGMTIGGHTLNHPILTRVSDNLAREEIGGGREVLETILKQPVCLFAYPNGKPGQDYDARHVTMVRQCGFEAAVSTAWGVSTGSRDPYQLARFTPWDQTPLRFAMRLVRNLGQTRPEAV